MSKHDKKTEESWPRIEPEGGWEAAHKHEKVGILWRLYALVPIVIVVFLSYKAIEYLIVSLVFPQAAPQQITEIPKKLTKEVWETRRDFWSGVVVAQNPRTPLAHYHQIDGWFQPDPHNTCTQSGCHNPMPHSRRKEVRAFLNMHATSINCSVCHLKSPDRPRPLVWYDLQTGKATEPPALLQAYTWVLSETGQKALETPTPEAQEQIVALLRRATKQADNHPGLQAVTDELNAVRYSSDTFKKRLSELPRELPLYFHGEYGAKLALRDPATSKPRLEHTGSEAAVREFLKLGASAEPQERERLLTAVHTERRPQTLECTDCHRQEQSLVDLKTVGYPQRRIESLYEKWIFRAIERINNGEPLYLPGFIGPRGGSQPSAVEPEQP